MLIEPFGALSSLVFLDTCKGGLTFALMDVQKPWFSATMNHRTENTDLHLCCCWFFFFCMLINSLWNTFESRAQRPKKLIFKMTKWIVPLEVYLWDRVSSGKGKLPQLTHWGSGVATVFKNNSEILKRHFQKWHSLFMMREGKGWGLNGSRNQLNSFLQHLVMIIVFLPLQSAVHIPHTSQQASSICLC